jgi:hypothetical protein
MIRSLIPLAELIESGSSASEALVSLEMCDFQTPDPDFKYVLIDATLIRVHQHGTGAKGDKIRPSKSRGGLTTKFAVIVDALGNLIRFVLLPGQP